MNEVPQWLVDAAVKSALAHAYLTLAQRDGWSYQLHEAFSKSLLEENTRLQQMARVRFERSPVVMIVEGPRSGEFLKGLLPRSEALGGLSIDEGIIDEHLKVPLINFVEAATKPEASLMRINVHLKTVLDAAENSIGGCRACGFLSPQHVADLKEGQ